MPRHFTVVAIVAAYNEADIIGQVVRALIDEGVQVYFLDHRSTDGTAAAVEPYRGRGVIGIEEFPADGVNDATAHTFAWESILKRKEELARQLDADWFIHHDADEFRESPWAGQGLRDAIRRVEAAGYNAIDFQVLNFRPTTADPVGGDDIRERLLFYEPGDVFDRQQIKCWKKTGEPVTLAATGGHSAEFAGRRICPIRFLLRHYPIRSQAHGERKVFQERRPRYDSGERARGWHVQYDQVSENASFVRDPRTLIRYDPEAVRFELFRHHREVEALHAELERLRAEHAATLRRHLQTQDDELGRLRVERGRLLDDVESQRAQVAAREATIAGMLASRSWRPTSWLRAADRWGRGNTALVRFLERWVGRS